MSSDGDKAALEIKIKNIDQQIVVLQEFKAQCVQKLQSLSQTEIPVPFQLSSTIHSDDKAKIFRGYFHGREIIYEIVCSLGNRLARQYIGQAAG